MVGFRSAPLCLLPGLDPLKEESFIFLRPVWRLHVALPLGLAALGFVLLWRIGPRAVERTHSARSEPASPPNVRFANVTEAAGIRFQHHTGASGDRLLPETMGSGCAFLDYDRDERPDLLFVDSGAWPGRPPAQRSTLTLYHNEGGRFVDVTSRLGLDVAFYGMGVAVGDFDNDGFPDVFVTAVGGNHLFHNEAGKRFVEVTSRAGVGGPGGWNWSTGATFLDYDNDGKLDLFVCNYVRWSPEIDRAVGYQVAGVGRVYGPPTLFEPTACTLYRNRGDGTFEDVSIRAGIGAAEKGKLAGKALSALAYDFDEDGWIDVAVANDSTPNFLFHNLGNGRFEEVGMAAGIALDAAGQPRGAMGIDAADYRNDGSTGLVIGNFAREMTAVYLSQPGRPLQFRDAALAEGVGPASWPLLKFGLFFFDYDLDGRLDLFTCNGHLDRKIPELEAGQQYAQPPQLFWNRGAARGERLVATGPAQVGASLLRPLVGRGCAYADIDGDGDLDLAITSNGGPAQLFRNDSGGRNHWVRVRLEGTRCNRDALGARVELTAGGVVQRRQVAGSRGYLSQSEFPLTFGLGSADRAERVTIHWPGGGVQNLGPLPADRLYRIRQE